MSAHSGQNCDQAKNTRSNASYTMTMCFHNQSIKLDSMRWFSHRRRGLCPQDCSGKKCRTRTTNQKTTPKQNAAFCCFFFVRDLDLLTFGPKFKLRPDFCTMHLIAKFHHAAFNHSELITLTNRQSDKQTDRHCWKHPPRSAMLRQSVMNQCQQQHCGKCI